MPKAVRSSTSIALQIEDINTAINHEPRVLDIRLGEALGMAQPLDIRRTVDSNRTELEGFGAIFAQRAKNTGRGRPATEYYLNEPQCLLLCMFSRTERAAEVRKMVIDVFMEVRRGQKTQRAGNVITVRGYSRKVPVAVRGLPKAERMAFYRQQIAEASHQLFKMGEHWPVVVRHAKAMRSPLGEAFPIDPRRETLRLPDGGTVIPLMGGGWEYEAGPKSIATY